MTYRVVGWFGRLGNNIQQVTNAIMLAEYEGKKFDQVLDHSVLNKFSIDFGNNDNNIIDGRFYSWEPLFSHQNTFVGENEIGLSKDYIYNNFRRVCKSYVSPNLNIPKYEKLLDDTVVIHLRSGDIFDGVLPTPISYVPNPLCFYLKLVEQFNHVIVVTEPDGNNPILGELKKYDKVTIQSKSVKEDFVTLMSAKHLALSGVGTFAMAAAMCSSNIKSLYTTDLLFTENLNYTMLLNTNVDVNIMELKNYIPVYPCSWLNTEEQRKFILTYGM